MKRQISLKWWLTFGVVAVLVVVGSLIGFFFNLMLEATDQRLYLAVQERAQANARAVRSTVAFEFVAGMSDDVRKKLEDFKSRHKDAYAIHILGPNKRKVIDVGETVDESGVLGAFPVIDESIDEKDTNVQQIGELVVALVPIINEGDVKACGWVMYVESLRSYYEARFRVNVAGGLCGLIGLVLAMFGTFWFGARAVTPMNKLVHAAQRIADGDLEHLEIEVGGSLETVRLAASIKSMAAELQKQVLAIKGITTDVSAVSREVASAMAHLASSASQQAAAVTETAATVEEMEKAGKSAGGNAAQIVEAAEKTTEASIRGRNAVETTSDIILRIKDDSQDISEKSKNLLAAVEEVGNIIGSVNGIAEQSKILAVNASIEAAKAGEFGSGFAVVAQEVKDLAQQSKDATLQITDTLTAIRQAIENMVATAQSGEERTDEGVRMIANAGAIMNDLSEAIRENSDFANVIATNINQQTVGLTQIATAIEEINSTALENQDISRKIEYSTRQMTGSVDHLLELVDRWRTPASMDQQSEAGLTETPVSHSHNA